MTTVPDGSVPSLVERMIRIEAKLDTYNTSHADHEGRIRLLEAASGTLANIEGRLQSGVTTFSDHEQRLRGLERRMWLTAGIALIGGAILGAVVGPLLGLGT